MSFKQQIISMLTYNIQGLFVRNSKFSDQLLESFTDQILFHYEERYADIILINLQETFELTDQGQQQYKSLSKDQFQSNKDTFFTELQKKIQFSGINCFYHKELDYYALSSFICTNQKYIGYRMISKFPFDIQTDKKVQKAYFKGCVSYSLELPGLTIIATNTHLNSKNINIRQSQIKQCYEQTMREFDSQNDQYKYPILYLLGGDINSRTLSHLNLEKNIEEEIQNMKKQNLDNCKREKNDECIDFLQRLLVEQEEWYDFFKFHKKERQNFFDQNFPELNDRKKFNFVNIQEAPISFLPTYKYDEQDEFIHPKNPSYTDRIFYTYSKQLDELNKVQVIHYDSFHIDQVKSDHKGVQAAIKINRRFENKEENFKIEEFQFNCNVKLFQIKLLNFRNPIRIRKN